MHFCKDQAKLGEIACIFTAIARCFHNYTNTNTITRIIKHVFHFSVKMCIVIVCDLMVMMKSIRNSKTFSLSKNYNVNQIAGHAPKKRKRKEIELFNVCFWFLLHRKKERPMKMCVLMIWRGTLQEKPFWKLKKKSTASAPWIYLESYLKWKLMDSSALAEIKLIINLEFQHDVAGTYHC